VSPSARRASTFDAQSPVAAHWLAHSAGFTLRRGLRRGRVVDVGINRRTGRASHLVVRYRSPLRWRVPLSAVHSVVPGRQLVVLRPKRRARRAGAAAGRAGAMAAVATAHGTAVAARATGRGARATGRATARGTAATGRATGSAARAAGRASVVAAVASWPVIGRAWAACVRVARRTARWVEPRLAWAATVVEHGVRWVAARAELAVLVVARAAEALAAVAVRAAHRLGRALAARGRRIGRRLAAARGRARMPALPRTVRRW
jgi:hypothetical protein